MITFSSYFCVILRSHGVMGSKTALRGVRAEKGGHSVGVVPRYNTHSVLSQFRFKVQNTFVFVTVSSEFFVHMFLDRLLVARGS